MDAFLLDDRMDPEAELIGLLDYNGIRYRREKDCLRMTFSDAGCKWETVCRTEARTVLVYGVYPFPAANGKALTALINELNGKLTRGGFFLAEERVVMRTSADLFDSYGAYEAIARAIEYNAGAIVRFWQSLAACAQANDTQY